MDSLTQNSTDMAFHHDKYPDIMDVYVTLECSENKPQYSSLCVSSRKTGETFKLWPGELLRHRSKWLSTPFEGQYYIVGSVSSSRIDMQGLFAYLDESARRVLPPLLPTNSTAGPSLRQPANASDLILWTCKLVHVLVSQGMLKNDALIRLTKWYSHFNIHVDTAGLIPILPGVDEIELEPRSSISEETIFSPALRAKRSRQSGEHDEPLPEEIERGIKRLQISDDHSSVLSDADQGPEIVGSPESM